MGRSRKGSVRLEFVEAIPRDWMACMELRFPPGATVCPPPVPTKPTRTGGGQTVAPEPTRTGRGFPEWV